MIGFYNYSVILTYVGMASGVLGMFAAMDGNIQLAVFCLMMAGICDMFDGKIARHLDKTTGRTKEAQVFGIQIDSLCDLVCFGVLPAIICRAIGMKGILDDIVLVFFILAGLIRLAFFNVCEEKRQRETTDCREEYRGLPITSSAIFIPLFYMWKQKMGMELLTGLDILMLITAVLYVADIRVKKPGKKVTAGFCVAAVLLVARML